MCPQPGASREPEPRGTTLGSPPQHAGAPLHSHSGFLYSRGASDQNGAPGLPRGQSW